MNDAQLLRKVVYAAKYAIESGQISDPRKFALALQRYLLGSIEPIRA
jgi:hypothetical protein